MTADGSPTVLPTVLEIIIAAGEGGIGINFDSSPNILRCGEVQRGVPAFGKIQSGDLLTSVNGKLVAEVGASTARQMLQEGGMLSLTLERPAFATIYKLGDIIGTGAFSKVYSCQPISRGDQVGDKVGDQKVAVKVINNHGMSEKHTHAMENEITALKKASHPNVLELRMTFAEGGVTYLITELLNGQPVLGWMSAQYPPPSDTTLQKLTFQLASALDHCHKLSIVHRDVKPDNIVMSR
jgi:serine/threonine protein kinase